MYILYGIIGIILGSVQFLIPEKVVLFEHRYFLKKGAEPSKFAIYITKVSGVLFFIAGIFLIMISI